MRGLVGLVIRLGSGDVSVSCLVGWVEIAAVCGGESGGSIDIGNAKTCVYKRMKVRKLHV